MLQIFQKNVIKLIQIELLFQLIGCFGIFLLLFTFNSEIILATLILPITCFVGSFLYLLFYFFSNSEIKIKYRNVMFMRIFWLIFGFLWTLSVLNMTFSNFLSNINIFQFTKNLSSSFSTFWETSLILFFLYSSHRLSQIKTLQNSILNSNN